MLSSDSFESGSISKSEKTEEQKCQELSKSTMKTDYYQEAIEVERMLGKAINSVKLKTEKLEDRVSLYKFLFRMCLVIMFASIISISIPIIYNKNLEDNIIIKKFQDNFIIQSLQDISIPILSGIGASYLFFSIPLLKKKEDRLKTKIEDSENILRKLNDELFLNDDSKKELPLPRQDDLESLFGLIDDR